MATYVTDPLIEEQIRARRAETGADRYDEVGRAKDCGTHFVGGPDFLVEVASRSDHSREKLPFYGRIGVREVMIIDRDPRCLELYRLEGGDLRLVAKSRFDEPAELQSAVVPLSFHLRPGQPRPQIEVTHRDGAQRWIV